MSSDADQSRTGDAASSDPVESVSRKLTTMADSLPEDQREALLALIGLAESGLAAGPPRDLLPLLDPNGGNHATLAAMRNTDPFAWSDELGGWQALGYDEIVAVERCPFLSYQARFDAFVEELPSRKRESFPTFVRMASYFLGHLDPPEHTRLRAMMELLLDDRHLIADQVDARIAPHLVAALDAGRADFVTGVAEPISLVAADLLGLDDDELTAIHPLLGGLAPHITDESLGVDAEARTEARFIALDALFRSAIEARQNAPAGSYSGSLIEAIRLVEPQGDHTIEELVSSCLQVVLGTFEAIRITLSMVILTLLRHPSELERLRSDPELVPSAVEELLRYDVLDQPLTRMAIEPFEMGGKDVRPGDRVFIRIAAANRDPRRFTNPDEFDLDRNPHHATFGVGRHYCPGAELARLVLDRSIRGVLAAWPHIALAQDPPTADPAYARRRDLPALPLRLER